MELLFAALIVLLLLVARSGRDINRRSYDQRHGDAPGANRTYNDRLSYLARGTR